MFYINSGTLLAGPLNITPTGHLISICCSGFHSVRETYIVLATSVQRIYSLELKV